MLEKHPEPVEGWEKEVIFTAAICERPRIGIQTKIVETRGIEALRLRIAAAQNGVLEARQLRGGEIVVSKAIQHLDNLLSSPGGLEALQSLSKTT